jgi:hypothetical protein
VPEVVSRLESGMDRLGEYIGELRRGEPGKYPRDVESSGQKAR